MMNGFGNMYGFGWIGMVVGTIVLLLVLALLAWAAFSIAARGSSSGTRNAPGHSEEADMQRVRSVRLNLNRRRRAWLECDAWRQAPETLTV